MSDQAERLRELAQAGNAPAAACLQSPLPLDQAEFLATQARVLLFASGKGGVGTSNLVLNLALALGRLGRQVVVVDADWGRANLDLLCGVTPSRDLGDVLAGDCTLAETLLPIGLESNVQLLPGAHVVRSNAELLDDASVRLASELPDLAHNADYLLIDAGNAQGHRLATLAAAADDLVLVTTPEPTAVADAHGVLARLRRALPPRPNLRLLVTQADNHREGADCLSRICASSREFLGLAIRPLGLLRADRAVTRDVRLRRPFVLNRPWGRAARGVRRLARSLDSERPANPLGIRRPLRQHPAPPRANPVLVPRGG